MRSTRRSAVFAVTALALSACATSGLYQARDAESGYAETQLGESHWRVEFVGDNFTSRETVETFLLYRAAELTAQNGDEWFAMSAPSTSEDVEIIIEGERPQAYRDRYWRPRWRRRSHFFWSDLDPVGPMPYEQRPVLESNVAERVHYSASVEIFTGRGAAPAGAFDAAQIIARLGPSIVRPRA